MTTNPYWHIMVGYIYILYIYIYIIILEYRINQSFEERKFKKNSEVLVIVIVLKAYK